MASARERLPDWPLRWLMAAGQAGTLLVLLLFLGGALYLLVHRYLWVSTQAGLIRQVGGAAGLERGGRTSSQAFEVARQVGEAGTPIRLLDAQGRVLFEAGPMVRALPAPPAEYLSPDRPRRQAWIAEAETRRGRLALLIVLVRPKGSRDGLVIQMGAPWWQARELLREFRRLLVLTGVAAMVLGLLVSLWFARALSRPLERLAAAAHRVAAGDLSARTGVPPGRNEIREVAGAFDGMASRLEESFAAQRRFLADASHELRTPLTAIGGMAELLAGGADEDPVSRARALETVEREVERMARLVDDLLVLSRAENPEAVRRREEVDLAEVVHEVSATARLAEPGRAVRVEAEGSLPVTGDRDALLRAVRNLVDNALQYSPKGTEVRVEATRRGGIVEVRVRDRGPGIPPQDLARVFDRFYRADPSRARRTGGSGLGLAIVQAVVRAHGGEACLSSNPGEGTEAVITLPASGSLQETAAAPSGDRGTMGSGERSSLKAGLATGGESGPLDPKEET